MIENITFKTLIFNKDINNNYKNLIEGKPKMIEIVNYGVHSTNNNSKKLVYIDMGNFLPSMNNLVCHVMDDNHFLTPCNLKFNCNSTFNGSFNVKIYDINTDIEISEYVFVLNLNLYY